MEHRRPHVGGVAKAIGGNAPAIRSDNADGRQRYALFANVPSGSRRMVVAVAILELLGGDLAVFENVIDDGSSSLVLYALEQLDEVARQVRHDANANVR